MSATQRWNNFIYKCTHARDDGIMFMEKKETPIWQFLHMMGQKYKVCVCMDRDKVNVASCLNVKVLLKMLLPVFIIKDFKNLYRDSKFRLNSIFHVEVYINQFPIR